MEKENKDNIENTKQEENSNEQNEQAKRKKYNIKKILFIALGITFVLCLGIFISFKIYTTEIHVYEEVENLGEREGVCFDNLLLSFWIEILNSSGEEELRYLCIFNTGDIYCFEWPEIYSWSIYYSDHIEYEDTVWERMYNVVYLGRLSNRDTIRLNQYVQDFDPQEKYYINYDVLGDIIVPNSDEKYWQVEETEKGNYIWEYYHVCLYQHGQSETKTTGRDVTIESCYMNYLSKNTYEKGEIRYKSYEENALAALELFESSEFYDIWVDMCLNNR